MATVKKYPNVLTGAFTASQTRESLGVPCRGASHVVQRLRSGANESAAIIVFQVGNNATGTYTSTAGQGYSTRGTAPVTLQQAGGQTVVLYCADRNAAGTEAVGANKLPFYNDFVRAQVQAPAGGLAASFALDLEVWYEEDADQMLLAQLNASSYTPV